MKILCVLWVTETRNPCDIDVVWPAKECAERVLECRHPGPVVPWDETQVYLSTFVIVVERDLLDVGIRLIELGFVVGCATVSIFFDAALIGRSLTMPSMNCT